MQQAALPWRHLLLALAVVTVWGSNFVVIKIGLVHLPPLLFAALRFTFALLPAAFFLRRPAVPWTNLAAYGVLIGLCQFGLMFLALRADISAGLASLVIQMQAFFTIGLAIAFRGERVRPAQWMALALALAGIGSIGLHSALKGDGATTPLGVLMVLGAALGWAGGNLTTQRAGRIDMLAYVVWASLFAAPPLFALSLAVEGPAAMLQGLRGADASTWAAVVWQATANVLFGYAAWGWLLSRHPAATVAPLAMLVPLVGMAASAYWLGEPLPGWKLSAAGLVLAGLALNLLAPRVQRTV